MPPVNHELIDAKDIAALKSKILASGLTVSQLVSTAWASASTFRGTDKRGGANGARIRLAPQKDWAVNNPPELAKVLKTLEGIQKEFNARRREEGLAGRPDRARRCAAVEKAAKDGGHDRAGAVHAGPHGRVAGADGRRVVRRARTGRGRIPQLHRRGAPRCRPSICWSSGRFRLTLSAPEMTVLVGGLRVLGANAGQSNYGVFTKQARDVDATTSS